MFYDSVSYTGRQKTIHETTLLYLSTIIIKRYINLFKDIIAYPGRKIIRFRTNTELIKLLLFIPIRYTELFSSTKITSKSLLIKCANSIAWGRGKVLEAGSEAVGRAWKGSEGWLG